MKPIVCLYNLPEVACAVAPTAIRILLRWSEPVLRISHHLHQHRLQVFIAVGVGSLLAEHRHNLSLIDAALWRVPRSSENLLEYIQEGLRFVRHFSSLGFAVESYYGVLIFQCIRFSDGIFFLKQNAIVSNILACYICIIPRCINILIIPKKSPSNI